MVDSVSGMLKHVRELVGEVDFSYQVVGSSATSARTSSSPLPAPASAVGKQKAH